MSVYFVHTALQFHRLQVFLNLQDSPGFLATVPGPGRLYYNCNIGPEEVQTLHVHCSINTVVLSSFRVSLNEPRIHERQEAVLYMLVCTYVCGVIISVRRELNFERVW